MTMSLRRLGTTQNIVPRTPQKHKLVGLVIASSSFRLSYVQKAGPDASTADVTQVQGTIFKSGGPDRNEIKQLMDHFTVNFKEKCDELAHASGKNPKRYYSMVHKIRPSLKSARGVTNPANTFRKHWRRHNPDGEWGESSLHRDYPTQPHFYRTTDDVKADEHDAWERTKNELNEDDLAALLEEMEAENLAAVKTETPDETAMDLALTFERDVLKAVSSLCYHQVASVKLTALCIDRARTAARHAYNRASNQQQQHRSRAQCYICCNLQ